MKKVKLISFFLIFLLGKISSQQEISCCSSTCTGKNPCTACTNCSGCKFCGKNGGTCGTCSKSTIKVEKKKPKENLDDLPYAQFFTGKIRASAKTSISKGKLFTYKTVGDLLKNLPTDGYMRQQGIQKNTRRTVDEDMNILIENAYVFYIKKEEDGDFHVVIGDFVNGEKTNLLTVEISGLPDERNPSYAVILETRKKLYNLFPNFFEGTQKSHRPRKKFLKVTLQGSLFFDYWHQGAESENKPNTVFELHPITKFESLGWENF